MATYAEIYTLATAGASVLQQKIGVALTVRAMSYVDGASPTAPQLNWAKECLQNPDTFSPIFLRALLAKNRASTTSQILAVSDTDMQTAVDGVVNTLLAR